MTVRLLALVSAASLVPAVPAAAQQAQPAAPEHQARPPTVREAAPDVRNRALADQVFLRLAASPSLHEAQIRVTALEGAVTLEGTVPSEQARERALRLASQTPGVRETHDQLRIESPAPPTRITEIDDRELARQVARQLATETFPGARARQMWLFGWTVEGPAGRPEIEVYADSGQVTLAGQVPAASDLAEAVRAARTVAGVRSVRADLSVAGARGQEQTRRNRAQAPPGESGVPRPAGQDAVGQDELERYAEALARMARFEPGIAVAAREGKPVDPLLLARIPKREAAEAIRQAGLSEERFGTITKRIEAEPSLKDELSKIVQQAQRPGGQSGQSQQ